MAYINKIQIPDLGSYNLYGLDTMVQVRYSNGSESSPSKNLSEALFGSNTDLKNSILNGTAVNAPETESEKGSLASYIKHIHDIDFKSKTITSLEKFTYKTIVDSPLNIKWDDTNEVGLLELKSNSFTPHSIQWSTQNNLLAFDCPDQTKITAGQSLRGLLLQKYGPTGDEATSLIPETNQLSYLGSEDKEFKQIYTKEIQTSGGIALFETDVGGIRLSANGPTLRFRKVYLDGKIEFSSTLGAWTFSTDGKSLQIDNSIIPDNTSRTLGNQSQHFGQIYTDELLIDTIAPMDSNNTITLDAKRLNCSPGIEICAPSGNQVQGIYGIIFDSVQGRDEQEEGVVIYPSMDLLGSLGKVDRWWSDGYFSHIKASAIEVSTIQGHTINTGALGQVTTEYLRLEDSVGNDPDKQGIALTLDETTKWNDDYTVRDHVYRIQIKIGKEYYTLLTLSNYWDDRTKTWSSLREGE